MISISCSSGSSESVPEPPAAEEPTFLYGWQVFPALNARMFVDGRDVNVYANSEDALRYLIGVEEQKIAERRQVARTLADRAAERARLEALGWEFVSATQAKKLAGSTWIERFHNTESQLLADLAQWERSQPQ